MTDKRMEYMQDALDYIEDEYIREAAEALGHARRKKERRRMIRVRVLQAAAVLVLCWIAYGAVGPGGWMRIGSGSMKETAADSWKEPETHVPVKKDQETQLLYEPFYYQKETQAGEPEGEETKAPTEETGDEEGLSAEEIFAQDTAVFRGTVDGMKYYKGIGTDETYFTVIEVVVSECYRGDLKEGTVCKIFIPFIPGYGTHSMAGSLDQLTIGSEAIFMPNVVGAEDSFLVKNGAIAYKDLADYYFTEGQRYLFLEKDGRMYYDNIFGILAEGDYVVMRDVVSYVKFMLNEAERTKKEEPE